MACGPGGHHLTSILLHAATAVLLFLVLRQMTGRLWPSAFVAAVFAIHPLRAESVAWVSERKDVLSGLFFMLILAAYLGYARRPFSLARYLVVVVLFALGLMAKPMLVTLPFLLLLLDYWPLGRLGRGEWAGARGERAVEGGDREHRARRPIAHRMLRRPPLSPSPSPLSLLAGPREDPVAGDAGLFCILAMSTSGPLIQVNRRLSL